MATKKLKSETIAERIAVLQTELAETRRAESEAADAELIRLAHKAGIRDELLALARRREAEQHHGKRATSGAAE